MNDNREIKINVTKANITADKQGLETEDFDLQQNDPEKEDDKEAIDPVKERQEKIDALEKEAKESYDRFLRVSAEFENYKKRAGREMEDLRKYANEALLKEFLPIVDNLELAIHSANNDSHVNNSIIKGVDLTLRGILKIFEKFNVKTIDSLKKSFDPVYHQAVLQEETDEHPDNLVIKELQKGYTIHGRLLRPAMVVVSKARKKKKGDENAKAPDENGNKLNERK
jgi:molecular chaperone GrpE